MPTATQRQETQPDAMVGLMRYLPEFQGQPDEALKGYLYRLFHDSTFGTPETRQQWQQNLLGKTWGTVQSVRSRNPTLFRDIPAKPSEFAQAVKQQSAAYRPVPEWQKYGELEVPRAGTPWAQMTTPERRYGRVLTELEQKYPGYGKELFYGVQVIKNLIGKHIAPLIAMTAAPKITPDWYKQWVIKRVEGLTPELDFVRQITRDYGQIAGFAAAFAEAVPGIMTSVGAARSALGILGATKIPMASTVARKLIASPVAFNTAFWGGYSAGAYNQTMHQLGKEPTLGGYAVNAGVGCAIGRMFPELGKLLKTKATAKEFVERYLTTTMDRAVTDLRVMGRGQLIDVMAAKGFKNIEMRRGLNAIRYLKQPTKSLVQDYLKQSTKVGVMGAVSGAVGSLTAGLPVDFPSLVHNAAFMMAFHAWGPVGEKIGPRMKPVEKVELPEGVLKIGEAGHRDLILTALEPVLMRPDMPMAEWLPEFTKRLQDAGVRRVEVSEGNIRDVESFARDYQAQTGQEAYRAALERYSRAQALFKHDPEAGIREWTQARASLDEIVAVMSRRAGENPNDVRSPVKNAAEKEMQQAEEAEFGLMEMPVLRSKAELVEQVGKGKKIAEKEGVLVVEVGAQERPGQEPLELYNVFKIGLPIADAIIKPGLSTGSTISAQTLRKFGLPVPGEKGAPPVKKPKPAVEVKPKVVKPVKVAPAVKHEAAQAKALSNIRKAVEAKKFDYTDLKDAIMRAEDAFKGVAKKDLPREIAIARRLAKTLKSITLGEILPADQIKRYQREALRLIRATATFREKKETRAETHKFVKKHLDETVDLFEAGNFETAESFLESVKGMPDARTAEGKKLAKKIDQLDLALKLREQGEKEGKLFFEKPDILRLHNQFKELMRANKPEEVLRLVEKHHPYIDAMKQAAQEGRHTKELNALVSFIQKDVAKFVAEHAKAPEVKGVRINATREEARVIKSDVDLAKMYVGAKPRIVNSDSYRKSIYEAAERYKVDTEGLLPDQVAFNVHQKILDHVYASTREKKDWPVAFIDGREDGRFGLILDVVRTKEDVKYRIQPYSGDVVEVSWRNVERSGESLRPYIENVERMLLRAEVPAVKRQLIRDQILDGGAKLYGGAGAFEWIGKLVRQHIFGAREKARQETILRAGFPERAAAMARGMREWRNTKDSMLMHLARILVYGDPKSAATPLQWQMIRSAIEANRTNPHALDPIKFIRATVGRTNFEPGVGGHKPLTRQEARMVLSKYAQISEAIRDRNWLVAMNVFLPSELKRWNPRLTWAWDNLNKKEHQLNAMNVDGNKMLEDFSAWGLADGSRVNPDTMTPEFAKFNAKAYAEGDLYTKWVNGRTIGDEVSGLLHRVINPRKDKFVSQLAKRTAREIEKSGFRERWWKQFDRAVEQRLRMWAGKMFVDKDSFVRSYTKWKMEDKKTTPENSDAMFLKFSEEAADIHGNKELLKKTVDTMVDSKRLGKIVDAEQKNAYYPRFYEEHPQRLLEQLEALERGELPSGRVGEFLSPHAIRRRLDRVQGLKLQKSDPVKDFASYMRNVSTFIWRNEVAFQLWAAKKGLMRDIRSHPQHARVFQHHIEIVDKLRSDILSYSDKFIDNVSLGLGNLAAAVFLAHPGTVLRNFTGGHALTAIYNGFGWFARGWKFRQTEEGQRILKMLGFELAAHWGFGQHETRGQLARELNQKPSQKALGAMNEVTRTITTYALSHPIPFVADMIPGLGELLKRVSFSGSEVHLRQVAFLAGYLRAREAVMTSPREFRHKSRITAKTEAALAAQARKKKLTDFDTRDVRPYKTKAGEEKFEYRYMTQENDAELGKRAFRAGMDGGMNSIVMTQFIYSRMNLPTIMNHPLGRLVLLFKRYTWNRFAFANRMIKDMTPGRGGGPEELARFVRFAIAMSGALTLSAIINVNLYRFIEDDTVSMWGQVMDWLKTGEIRPYGRPAYQYLSGAFFGRLMDAVEVFEQGEVDWSRKITRLPITPYGRYINDILVEQQKVAEGRKSIFDAVSNKLGFYYYNYDGGVRRERRGRRGR